MIAVFVSGFCQDSRSSDEVQRSGKVRTSHVEVVIRLAQLPRSCGSEAVNSLPSVGTHSRPPSHPCSPSRISSLPTPPNHPSTHLAS